MIAGKRVMTYSHQSCQRMPVAQFAWKPARLRKQADATTAAAANKHTCLLCTSRHAEGSNIHVCSQVYYNNSDDNSYMDYDNSELGGSYRSYMHSCSDVEFKGSWARFHLDMGTADELAFDVLLNMLVGFSSEVAGMNQIIVGGEHERWAIPENDEDDLFGDDRKPEHGEAPRVSTALQDLIKSSACCLYMLSSVAWYVLTPFTCTAPQLSATCCFAF